MLVQDQRQSPTPQTSASRITSSPSLSSQTHPPSPSPQPMQSTHDTEEPALMPHESPLQSIHSLGRDEGSMQQNELTDLITKLTERVTVLENDLQQTKKVYSSALTKLILKIKKLEKSVKSSKAKRRVRIEDVEIQEKNNADTEILLEQEEPTELVEDFGSGEKGEKEVSTTNVPVSTAGAEVSTASTNVSTVAESLVYIRRSAEKMKDKGKAIMTEPEPPKKIKKKVQVQMSLDEELAWKFHEKELERFNVEQKLISLQREQEKVDFDTALELKKKLDKREEHVAKAQDIDWSDPDVLRYHALQNRPYSMAEVRKNMCMYLKNQGGYKMSYFKGMKYKEKRARETQSEESIKKQKQEDDAEEEELRLCMKIVSDEDIDVDYEVLDMKYPIVDWESQILANLKEKDIHVYKITRADGNSKYYPNLTKMLETFDRDDLLDLHRLVMERFPDDNPVGCDLLLWGDLKILVDSKEDDCEV
ncbi:hypothetical protein Tco_0401327 [Tanacetum coccineum]